jgi:hypothetical protein
VFGKKLLWLLGRRSSSVSATNRERRERFFNFRWLLDELADRFIDSGMRLIDHCPNCLSSTSSSDEASATPTASGAARKKRRKLFLPSLVFGDGKLDARDYYSKFYTSPAVQLKSFCAGKKYEIERKHKIKKRDMLNAGLSNARRRCTTSATNRGDNIKGESY